MWKQRNLLVQESKSKDYTLECPIICTHEEVMECLTLMFNFVKADHEKIIAEMKKKEEASKKESEKKDSETKEG